METFVTISRRVTVISCWREVDGSDDDYDDDYNDDDVDHDD
jgi:hypothetical protein